jgi:hypothetical protein
MWASVLDRGECGPIAQLKGASGLLEIRRSKVAQMQAIAGGEYQMIESAKLCKEGRDRSFVRDVNRLPLCLTTDTINRLLNSFRIAGGDNDLGSLRGRLLGDCQTNPRRPTYHDHPFLVQILSLLHGILLVPCALFRLT